MPSRFFRRWDGSRGDEFHGWGPSVWYFEVVTTVGRSDR
jgi:hypothetical protein